MKRYRIGCFILVLALIFALSSCASTSARGKSSRGSKDVVEVEEQKVELEAQAYADALFGEDDFNVVRTRIRGEGPDGAYFDWIEMESNHIVLTSGIRRGEWTLIVQGLDENNDVVAVGTMTTFLSENSPVANVILRPTEGSGNISARITWNPAQVHAAKIEIYMQDAQGGTLIPRPASEITLGSGNALWEATNIPTGSYIIRVILRDGDYSVGMAAALRVYDGKLSTGVIPLNIGDISTAYGITAVIPNINGNLVVDGSSVTFIGSGHDDICWYLDGELLGSAQSVILDDLPITENGHLLDVIATNGYGNICHLGLLVVKDFDGSYTIIDQESLMNLIANQTYIYMQSRSAALDEIDVFSDGPGAEESEEAEEFSIDFEFEEV